MELRRFIVSYLEHLAQSNHSLLGTLTESNRKMFWNNLKYFLILEWLAWLI